MAIDKRLEEAMRARGIRAVDLAEKTGIPKSSISHYMAGHNTPKTDRIYYMATAINVNPAWLLGYDVPMENNASIPDDEKDLVELREEMRRKPGMRMLFSLAKNATNEDLEAVARMMAHFKGED